MSEITNVNVSEEVLEDFEDIYESPSDCHRAAAYHFRQAAKQQDLAAQACRYCSKHTNSICFEFFTWSRRKS